MFNESVDLHVTFHGNASTPEVCGVKAVGNAGEVNAAGRHRLVNVNQFVKVLTDSIATASTVFEYQQGRVVGNGDAVQDALHRFGNASDASLDPGPHVGADVDVDERGTVFGCHTKLVTQQLHCFLTEDRVRPSEVRQIGSVHGEWPEAMLLHAGAKGGQLLGELGAACPASGIAGEDL